MELESPLHQSRLEVAVGVAVLAGAPVSVNVCVSVWHQFKHGLDCHHRLLDTGRRLGRVGGWFGPLEATIINTSPQESEVCYSWGLV